MIRRRKKTVRVTKQPRQMAAAECDAQKMPSFMEKDFGMGLEGLGPTDYAWRGLNNEIDPDKLLAERGYDPLPPLDYILLGVIHGYVGDNSSGARLASIRRALGVGKTDDPRNKADYGILLEMGWQYLHEKAQNPTSEIEFQPIARACFKNAQQKGAAPKGGTDSSQIRRLSAKFKKDLDIILARLTFDKTPERVETLRKISSVLQIMNSLGIKTTWDHVVPVKTPL